MNIGKLKDQFEDEWRDGRRPNWRNFLPPQDDPQFGSVLLEIAIRDIHHRLRAGEQPPFAEEYWALAHSRWSDEQKIELLTQEYQARWDRGETAVRRLEYLHRFPELAAQLDGLAPKWKCPYCGAENQLRSEEATEDSCNSCSRVCQVAILFSAGAGVAYEPTSASGSSTTLPSSRVLRIFGRYRVLELLGAGGMGEVFRAEDTHLKRMVALKIPFLRGDRVEEVRARFLREAQSAAALQHANICPIFDLGEIDGTPFLTMPLLAGRPLSHQLKHQGALPPQDALRIVHKLALALQFAHEREVIHRDLKPSNIMMDDRDEPIIMDFGLARRADCENLTITPPGRMVGTPAYMAPEQLSGKSDEMGPACDIYSLGVVLYELLTNRKPFEVTDIFHLLGQIITEPPTPPSSRSSSIDDRIDRLCLKALAKRPDERWSSMGEFAAHLEQHLKASEHSTSMLVPNQPLQKLSDSSDTWQGVVLALRVKGTPYLYRPKAGQDVITVGRQRRKPGESLDKGNDFVLRAAGNDRVSTRISRRHFEIRRQDEAYHVVHDSKHGLTLNGKDLEKNKPALLQSGDILLVAGILELEVVLHQEVTIGATCSVVQVPISQADEQVVMEASLGDLITAE